MPRVRCTHAGEDAAGLMRGAWGRVLGRPAGSLRDGAGPLWGRNAAAAVTDGVVVGGCCPWMGSAPSGLVVGGLWVAVPADPPNRSCWGCALLHKRQARRPRTPGRRPSSGWRCRRCWPGLHRPGSRQHRFMLPSAEAEPRRPLAPEQLRAAASQAAVLSWPTRYISTVKPFASSGWPDADVRRTVRLDHTPPLLLLLPLFHAGPLWKLTIPSHHASCRPPSAPARCMRLRCCA